MGEYMGTLVSVLSMKKYKAVLTALQGKGPFTVFAPTDAAFAAAGVDVNDKKAVTDVLKYHVVSGQIMSSQLKKKQSVDTLLGEPITVTKKKGKVTVNGDATVVTADVKASNGVVHIINSVLIPPKNIVQLAAGVDSLSTLAKVVTSSQGVKKLLSGKGPFTVFAPTNDAFADAGVDALDIDTVIEVLRYHVLEGEVPSSALKAS